MDISPSRANKRKPRSGESLRDCSVYSGTVIYSTIEKSVQFSRLNFYNCPLDYLFEIDRNYKLYKLCYANLLINRNYWANLGYERYFLNKKNRFYQFLSIKCSYYNWTIESGNNIVFRNNICIFPN